MKRRFKRFDKVKVFGFPMKSDRFLNGEIGEVKFYIGESTMKDMVWPNNAIYVCLGIHEGVTDNVVVHENQCYRLPAKERRNPYKPWREETPMEKAKKKALKMVERLERKERHRAQNKSSR